MAEYIEKQELKNYLDCEIDFGGIDNRLMVLSKIDEVPTADVVERDKIDKAIEEIEKQEKLIIEYEGESDLGIAIKIIKECLCEVEE